MKKCVVPGCSNKHSARGYCKPHYDEALRNGRISVIQVKGLSLKDRLALRSRIAEGTGCVEWQGSKDRDGYGLIGVGGSLVGTHRVAWEIENGPVPDGLNVLHKCDNPSCVNPEHLFVGTQLENVKDMMEKNRLASRKGVRNSSAKVTEEVVKAIRSDSRPSKQIAGAYGLNRNTVWLIKSGRSWSHVT